MPINNDLIDDSHIVLWNEEYIKEETENEKFYRELDINKETSYEGMLLKVNNSYNIDSMYGELIVEAANELPEVFATTGIAPIPVDDLQDKKLMKRLRSYYRYNRDMPANMEDVNPMKFEPNLKPIEEFRYTPVSAIPEKDLELHRKKIDALKRSREYFEIPKSTIKYYTWIMLFGIFIFKTVQYFNKDNEQVNYVMNKARLRRLRYREDDDFVPSY